MPPNLPAGVPRMPSSVPAMIRQPFNQTASIIESFIRGEQISRDDEEWLVGGSGGGGGDIGSAAFFPRYLPGAVAYTTAPNAFVAPQTIYYSIESGQTYIGLTITAMVDSVIDITATAFTILNSAGSSVFSVAAGGNTDIGGTLAVGTADAFTVSATGAIVGLSISLASAVFTVSSTGLLDVNIGPAEFRTGGNSNVGVRVLQNSGSQSANLLECTDSAGTSVLSFLNASGGIGLTANSFMTYNRTFSWSSTTPVFNSACAFTGTSTDQIDFACRGITLTQASSALTALDLRPFNSGAGTTNVYSAFRSHPQIIGTPAAGFGQRWSFAGQSSTTNDRDVAALVGTWAVATDASRTGQLALTVFSTTTEQEGIRVTAFSTGCVVTIGNDANYDGLVVNENGEDADTRIEGNTDTDLFFVDAGADAVGISTNAPGSTLDVAGSFQCDTVTNDTGLAHGTFTPTRSAEANLDSNVTMSQAQYMRVGNTVTMSGRFTADPTTPATATSFEFSLPVASNLGASEDLAGVAFCGAIAGQGAAIRGSAANNTAVVEWVSGDVTSQTWSYTLTYEVL